MGFSEVERLVPKPPVRAIEGGISLIALGLIYLTAAEGGRGPGNSASAYNLTVKLRLKLIGWRSEKPLGTLSRAGDV